jgi:hypothetical protein
LPSGRIKLAISTFCSSLIAAFTIVSRSIVITTKHGPARLLVDVRCTC